MRVAIHQVGEAGLRAGRILLGERRLSALGMVGRRPNTATDPRLEAAGAMSSYDVFVTDETDDPLTHARTALDAGVNCVLWHDGNDEIAELGEAFAGRQRSLLVGANLANGLAPCLASHETARTSTMLDVSYAWTEPGRPLRKGEPIPFPDPIGGRWGRRLADDGNTRRLVATVDGEWAGAMARVTEGTMDGVIARVVGVADLAPHLEALALVAGTMSVTEYPYGLVRASDRADHYLTAALEAGLDVATYSMEAGT